MGFGLPASGGVVKKKPDRFSNQRGAGLLEVTILTALISLAIVTAVDSIAYSIQDSFRSVPEEFAGGETLTSVPELNSDKTGGGSSIVAPLFPLLTPEQITDLQLWLAIIEAIKNGDAVDPNWVSPSGENKDNREVIITLL